MIARAFSPAPSICGSAGRTFACATLQRQRPAAFRNTEARRLTQKLKEIWVPQVAFTNFKESPSYETTSLRIFPDGWVELMQRTTGPVYVSR